MDVAKRLFLVVDPGVEDATTRVFLVLDKWLIGSDAIEQKNAFWHGGNFDVFQDASGVGHERVNLSVD